MGIGISLGVVEIGEIIAGAITGAEAAEGIAGAETATEAIIEAAEQEAIAGGATEAEAAEIGSKAGADFGAKSIAKIEEAKIQSLISKIKPLSGDIAEDIANFNEELNTMINEGAISEEGAEVSQLIEDVTDEEISSFDMTREEFNSFEIEASEEFGELGEEAKSKFQELKKLGIKVINKIKQAFFACKKSIGKALSCIATLTEIIVALYDEFFKKKGLPPNVIPSFKGTNAYETGVLVGELTAQAIGDYYDELVVNPSIAKNEEALDGLILSSFKKISNELHNLLARRVYSMIRSSEFIKGPEVQKKFDEVYSEYNGRFEVFPFRDKKTNLITFVDEKGKRISYKGKVNLNSVTTFYGTWCGPISYNDTYPLWEGRKPEEGKVVRTAGSGLLDSFCFAHDCDYDFLSTGGGWFNQIGDFKLISRILSTYELMEFKEQSVALMTVAWFSTLGTILNTYLHPLIINFDARDPIRTFVSDEAKDIYNLLFPKTKKNFTGQIILQGSKEENVGTDRKQFYKGLQDKLRESQVDFVSRNGHGFTENKHSNLLKYFDNLLVFDC